MTTAPPPADPRADATVRLEIVFHLVTAGSLVLATATSSEFGLSLGIASVFGIVTAAWLGRAAHGAPAGTATAGLTETWGRLRPWAALFLANLALSPWADDRAALAALWLPTLTVAAIRWNLGGGRRAEHVSAAEKAMQSSMEVLPIHADAKERLQTLEWTQTQDGSGLRRLTGQARLTFCPGQRQTELHLSFCPPFGSPPELVCEQVCGPDAKIKLTQVMCYGARVEVQRNDSAAWCVVGIEFTAAPSQPSCADGHLRRAS